MKKFLSVFVAAMLICLSFVCANAEEIDANAPEAPWYELSSEGTILTVRLPGNNKDGMDW